MLRTPIPLYFRWLLPCCGALCALDAARALAEEAPRLAPVVVTGSRLPAAEAPFPHALLVIPESRAKDRAPASLPDLLRALPTLHVDQAGAPGGFSSLYLRGADPNHTVVMIDGVKIGDPTNSRGGGVDLSALDPRTIARIEILPGASSAIYGSDAMAGAVNIITTVPRQTGLQMTAGAGGDGYRTGAVAGAIRTGDHGVGAAAAATDDGRAAGQAFLRVRTQSLRIGGGDPERSVTAWVRAWQREGRAFPEDSGGPRLALRRELEHRDDDSVAASLNGEARTRWGVLRMYSNLFHQQAHSVSPGVAPGVRDPGGLPATRSDSSYVRSAIGVVAVLERDADAAATVGAQWEMERGDLSSTLAFGPAQVAADFALERRTYSLFAEGKAKLGERVSAHLGLRSDRTDHFGTPVTVRSGLHYRPGRDAGPVLALSYATGFKSPSFFALGHPLIGNPRLQAEKSRTLELGAFSAGRESAARPFTYRATLFRSVYRNLVDFDAGPPPRLVNRGEIAIQGYEASVALRLGAATRVQAGVTGLAFDLPAGTAPLRNRPRLRATAAASHEFTPNVTAVVYGSWTDRVYDSSIPTGLLRLEPYFLMDATITSTTRGVRLTLAIDNLFNERYEQFVGFPGRARRARVQVGLDI